MKINRFKIEEKIASFFARIFSFLFSYKLVGYLKYLNERVHSYCVCYSLNYDKTNTFEHNVVVSNRRYTTIGHNNIFRQNVILSTWKINEEKDPLITIGNGCDFGRFNHITCCSKITIGNGVLTGMFVLITDNSHGDTTCTSELPPKQRQLNCKGDVIIEDNVWIGDKVTILPGVRIGEGAVIGANSVVTKDIPSNTIAVGAPAKIIKVMKR